MLGIFLHVGQVVVSVLVEFTVWEDRRSTHIYRTRCDTYNDRREGGACKLVAAHVRDSRCHLVVGLPRGGGIYIKT